ncbi:hypothetical protein R1sor_002843 [Riccia sorocarpa]|uniref:Uncharacterized protein n=1 Tax=Riccia sorocarpa TaxID=122646 RepID=A0ABD3H441_9MARC
MATLAECRKFDWNNYDIWSYPLHGVLMSQRLWSIVDGSEPKPATPAADVASQEVCDQQAQSIIDCIVKDAQMFVIKTKTTAKEKWGSLEDALDVAQAKTATVVEDPKQLHFTIQENVFGRRGPNKKKHLST